MDKGRDLAVRSPHSSTASMLSHPALWLVLAVVLLALIATQPIDLPIGPMYWDSYIYFDAAHRIDLGQLPIVDFFVPIGPLSYFLTWVMTKLFPNGQPLLMAQWSMLIVTVPAMLLILSDVAARSRWLGFALLVPFLVFAILPINVIAFFSYPGVDGFGIYNRHAAHLLYLTTATVFFVRGNAIKTVLLCILVVALFLTKITAFLSGGLVLAFALLCGLVTIRQAIVTAVVFFAALALLEALTGMTSAYAQAIITLATSNTGYITSRFLTATSLHIGVIAMGGIALLYLLYDEFSHGTAHDADANALTRVFDRDWLWLGVLLFAGLFFETQNTGSHGFILLWPGLLFIWLRRQPVEEPRRSILLVLIAFVCVPSIVSVLHKAGRAVAVAPTYEAIENRNLRNLGQVSAKPVFMKRAEETEQFYKDNEEAIAALAARGELISFILYSIPSFQVLWLQIHDDLIDAIRAHESEHGVTFETIMSIDFTNILPYLMDRNAPRYVGIAADPFRTLGVPDPRAIEAVNNSDLIVYRRCPMTSGQQALLEFYRPALVGKQKIELTPCFDAYIDADGSQ